MRKNPYSSKFVVFEGLDGAGCGTQTKLLVNYLEKQKKPLKKLSYPDLRGPIGRLISQYLHKKYDFPVDIQFLLYFADFIKDKEKINQWLKNGKTVVSDRYFSSTLAYQGVEGFSIKRALKIAKIFELPKPDFIIYLKISPDISIKRKIKEKKKLDRRESDKKFLKKLANFYGKLIKNKVFCPWIVIDGEKGIKEVSEEIKKVINKNLKL